MEPSPPTRDGPRQSLHQGLRPVLGSETGTEGSPMAQSAYTPRDTRRGFRFSTRDITITGTLGAVAVVLGLVPGIGFIPAPTPAGSATTMHIPVILAGMLEGPVVGALVGAIFGFFSFTRATIPVFKNPIIAFGPRILIGVFAFL